jgi:hypothetical protein
MPSFDGNTLYWMQDGQLITDSGDAVTQYIGADYRLLHGDGKTALVWTTAIDETRSGILASILQPDGAWGIATLLCEYEGSIAFWDGWIENGWNFVVTATDGQTAELAHIKAFPKTETVLTLVENDERELNADGTLPIKLHVTNTGELGASAFDVAVTGSGYSFSQTVTQELNPGKSGVIELNIPMPGLSAEQEFVVSAYPANESDLSDNESVITLGKHDLKLAVTEYSIGDSVIIAATVTNLTQADTAASIRLESSGATVTSADLGVITNGTQSIFFFELDRNMIVFENGVKLYTLTVESGFDEMSDVNNVASILVSDYSAGAAVTGTVASYNPGAATTLKLLQGETEVGLAIIEPAAGTGEAEQAFAFEGVAPGTYTLVVTKPGHAKYTVHNIVVGETDADLALIALPCGDVNGDGNINGNDLTELWKAANYNKQADDADNPLCDLTGDGNINGTDLTILWLAANYNKGAVIVE